MTGVIPIRLPLANAYLVLGERPILVDTGAPGDGPAILAALDRHGVAPRDLALILLTHGHGDHAGSAGALRERSGAPIAVHAADADMLAAGRNRPFRATSLEARLLRPFVDRPFPTLRPDILLEEEASLAPYGVAGSLLFTPGHTAGSLSLLLDDGAALVGDLLMGGWLGGALFPGRPRPHYFAEDAALLPGSLARVLGRGVERLYVGHGGPLAGAALGGEIF